VFGYDFFQKHPKLWNVPLSIPQFVQESALGVLGVTLECRIERPARRYDAQIPVEHKDWLADRVDNSLGKCARIRDGGELFSKAGMHDSSASFSLSTTTAGKPLRGYILCSLRTVQNCSLWEIRALA
jgi:hypothetical protein